MATIAVRVGREIKEISGLTKSTTCWDVVLALLKERQLNSEGESTTGGNENTTGGGHGTEESASNSSVSKSIKELAQSHVIVENWRGCEKPIPPRTRILNVWQAWGKEQRHVELSLKKSKHIRFREGGHHHSRSRVECLADKKGVDPEHYSLHCMTSHQKRKIRRNMRQYQRALMMKKTEDCGVESEEPQTNNDEADSKIDAKVDKANGLILSEEKFIDGFLTDPDGLVKRADRAQLISQGTFNREFCKYRRRNRRRGSSNSRQHRRHQVSHYPYSSQHDKPRSSRRTKSKSAKYHYSTDDTSTTTSMSNTSEDENASDADDEKSVLVELRNSTPRRNHSYTVGLAESVYGGTTTTATDSSTTTSGDSMTSSMGGSTSSETSSGGDYFLPELHRLSYGAAIDNAKNLKAAENSSNKPKKNKSILKPALNLIESFRKSNKKKANKKNPQVSDKSPLITNFDPVSPVKQAASPKIERTATKTLKETNNKSPKEFDCTKPDDSNITKEKEISKSVGPDKNKVENKSTAEEESDERGNKDEILQSIQSQDIVLKNQRNRLIDTDAQIQLIENDVHNLRARALGKNYVQDTYLDGFVDPESNGAMTNLFNGPSIPVTTSWILKCEDEDMLERFIKMSEKIVEMQLRIEEANRKSEILLQDMQEEVWRVSAGADISRQGRKTASKAAALMFGLSDEDSSDEEDGHELLSVKSFDNVMKESSSPEKEENPTSEALHLELETSRTELEASLYLSLRLEAEIDEIEGELENSDDLIQEKGITLIDCVRDLAMSEEGVPPEIWEEYGELLTAYDIEIGQRRSLDDFKSSDITAGQCREATEWSREDNTLYIDATSPNPTSHCGNQRQIQSRHNDPQSISFNHNHYQAAASTVNQSIPPYNQCERCKFEGQFTEHKHVDPQFYPSPHVTHNAAQQPTLFSKLPLPTPINSKIDQINSIRQARTTTTVTPLLPMLPIPGELMSLSHHNDSDYEDLPDLTSMGPPDPTKSSRRLDLLEENENSNNTDDSGNASAGSTTSFVSSDGSRNSSCDGGSPRPIPIMSDANPNQKQIFGRNGVLRGSWKGHFVFPSNPKQTLHHSLSSVPSSQVPPSPSSKNVLLNPEILQKPSGLTFKRAAVVDSKEQEMMMQQQRLIRRNSTGKNRRNEADVNLPNMTKLKNVSSGLIHPKELNGQNWNRAQAKLFGFDQSNRFNTNYDNDSDTGRSSLHSVDSDQITFSETLV